MSETVGPADRVSAAQIVAELAMVGDAAARRAERTRYREDALAFRLKTRQAQGLMRSADTLAKLSGGSLLTATVLLIVNGHAAWPIVMTAILALLFFSAATICLMWLDQRVARFDHAADLIEAALEEARQ